MKNMIGFHKPYTCSECPGYVFSQQEVKKLENQYSEVIEILKKVQSGEIRADLLNDILEEIEGKHAE